MTTADGSDNTPTTPAPPTSTSRRAGTKGRWWKVVAGGVVVGIGTGAFAAAMDKAPGDGLTGFLSAPLPVLITGLLGITFAAAIPAYLFAAADWHRRDDETAARRDVEEAEADVAADTDTSLAQVWRVTQLRIGLYHKQALEQSRASFRNAWISASAGLAVLSMCAFIAVRAGSATGAITVGTLGAVGVAVSGYLGATFLRTQDLVARQSQTYFEQAADAFRYLSAERLLEHIKDDAINDGTVSAMARTIVGGAGAAPFGVPPNGAAPPEETPQ